MTDTPGIEKRLMPMSFGEGLNLWNGARLLKTAPISREMILSFVSEWDLGLPKSY